MKIGVIAEEVGALVREVMSCEVQAAIKASPRANFEVRTEVSVVHRLLVKKHS